MNICIFQESNGIKRLHIWSLITYCANLINIEKKNFLLCGLPLTMENILGGRFKCYL